MLKQRIGATARRPGLEPQPSPVQPRQRVLGPNPWLPWVEPRSGRPSKPATGITAVIPTAGKNLPRLLACVVALGGAAINIPLEVIVVVCPCDNEAERREIERVLSCFSNVEVVRLPGPFNYPRSVNYGVWKSQESHVLLLNDDAFFTGEGGLDILLNTMSKKHWGCIGPWLSVDGVKSPGQIRRLSEPVVGACVLWDREWLDRTGEFDENFGIGYGHDESDHTLRGRNLGMVWGRDETVIVEHENHATFGDDVCKPGSPVYDVNVEYWKQKWGDIPSWCGAPYWEPMPGCQVIIAGHNVAPWLKRCLDSVELCMEGRRWMMVYVDDGSTDGSAKIAHDHETSADEFIVIESVKSTGAGQAKNRALRMGTDYGKQYPAVLLMDADDVMLPGRVNTLLPKTVDSGLLLAHGTLTLYNDEHPDGIKHIPSYDQQRDGWLSPCTTIIHSSLIPDDGKLFREDLKSQEDSELFLRWYTQGIISEPFDIPTHEYHMRSGSVMTSRSRREHITDWEEVKAGLLDGIL